MICLATKVKTRCGTVLYAGFGNQNRSTLRERGRKCLPPARSKGSTAGKEGIVNGKT